MGPVKHCPEEIPDMHKKQANPTETKNSTDADAAPELDFYGQADFSEDVVICENGDTCM